MNLELEADRRLRAVPEEPTSTPIDDGVLMAYQQGRLSAERAEDVEAQLARDPEARALLAELSSPVDAELAGQLVQALRPRRRGGPRRAVAAVLAAAAAFALWLTFAPAPAPMSDAWPSYQLELDGFVAARRSVGSTDRRLLADSILTVTIRPDRRFARSPTVGLFRLASDGRWRTISAGKTTAANGAVAFEAHAGELFATPGRYTLAIAATPTPEALLTFEGQRTSNAQERGLGWWTFEVEYLGADVD